MKNEDINSIATICDEDTTPEQLIFAIENLGPRYEDPTFWSDIADSNVYSTTHRRHCIFQLFYRHIQPGIKLSIVSDILRTPLWIKKNNIVVVGDVAGNIPVKSTFNNTIFRIEILPNVSKPVDHWQIYISITGAVTHDEFCDLLFGNNMSAGPSYEKVLEVGFHPEVVNSFINNEEPNT